MGTFSTDITAAEGLTASDYTVSYASSNEDLLYISGADYIAGETKGSVDVTVTVTPSEAKANDYEAVNKVFTVKVVAPNAHSGLTQDDAFTVAEAIEAIDEGVDEDTEYYVKGIISDVEKYNSNYNSINYWISDDGTTKQFECYSGMGLNGANFSSIDDLEVGTEVIVKGTLTKYKTTYEFSSGNEIVWMKADERVDIATINGITPLTVNVGDTGTFTLDITFADGTDASDYEVTLTSGDDNKLTVENNGDYLVGDDAGTVTITVAVEPADDESYKAVSETYTITIVDPNVKGTETNPYSVSDIIAMSTAPSDNVYVTGWVVGIMKSGPVISTTTSEFAVSNIALADSPEETDAANAIAVQFSNNSARASLNLKDCPYNLGVAKYLLVGKVGKAFGKMGLQTTLVASKKIAEQVSITAAGMATYYTDCALDFTDVEDIYAYTATLSGDAITFSRVKKVPAETGVLLRNPNGEVAVTKTVPVVSGEAEAVTDNKLVGTLEDKTVSTEGYYILNNGSNGLGFYRVKSTGSKVAAHRAYLDATGATSRTFIGFNDGEVTGISQVADGKWKTDDSVYNLNGQRVNAPTKGLYIVNGKKVVKN